LEKKLDGGVQRRYYWLPAQQQQQQTNWLLVLFVRD
jgi:hypothetical protein